MFERLIGPRISLMALTAALAAAAPARAQTESGQLVDIVVTAQKRSENLQDVPISVSAISGDHLAAAGITSAAALTTAVAGLAINSTSQYFSPHVRGVGTTSFGPGVENPVALYVDNVYYASQLMAPSDLSDVDQVAVLKGPQGTLFGRNATAGVIQMTTREPKHDFGGELKTGIDNFLTSRSFAYVTGGLSDALAANLALKFTTQGDGWGRNLVTGEDIHKIDHDFAARTKWLWTPGDQTTIRLSLDYSNQRNSLGPNLRPAIGSTPSTPGLGNPVPGFNYVSSNPYDVASPINNLNRLEAGGGSLNLEQETGFGRIVSITAYRKYNFKAHFDTTASAALLSDSAFTQAGNQFSQEVQLLSRNNSKFNWTIGLYYFRDRETTRGPVATLYGLFVAPPPMGFGGSKNALNWDIALGTESFASFGQFTYEFLPHTRLTGGLRYNHEKRSFTGTQNVTIDDAFTIPLAATDQSDTVSRYTFRIALDHDFADGVMGYASFNRGFKSGGFNGLTQNFSDPPYKPETLDAYEVGFKTELLGRSLRLNPALFYYKYGQIQVTQFTATSTFIRNGAKAELYGFDLDAEWQVGRALNISGGLEWLHSEFRKFPGAPAYFPNPAGGNIPGFIDASGNQLPFAPKFTANISATYTLYLDRKNIDFNMTDAYNSGYFTEPDNRLRQKRFNLLNASVTLRDADDRWSIGIWGRNLLDKAVLTQLSGFLNADAADYGNPPRTYGATLRYKF